MLYWRRTGSGDGYDYGHDYGNGYTFKDPAQNYLRSLFVGLLQIGPG